jgi:putative serine protease PepD
MPEKQHGDHSGDRNEPNGHPGGRPSEDQMTQTTPGWQTPTPPPPPPPTWYGETAPLPTTPPLATTPPPNDPWGPSGSAAEQPRPRQSRRWVELVAAAVVAAVVSGVTTGIVLSTDNDNNGSGSTATSSSPLTGNSQAPLKQVNGTAPDWTATASAVEPSVVAITVGSEQSGQEAQGSGIILDTSGHVLTNNHVATATDGPITVTTTDQRTYNASVVGTDPTTDLAVLKIQNPPSDLKPASLGDSNKLSVGQPVMAIGNPLGLADTVTTGIVSALDRPVTTQAANGQGSDSGGGNAVITNAIQTDAAINPGNSGGALVTADGQVIGINSSIASLSDSSAFGGGESGSIGLGFAIPINEAKTIAQQLISTGTVKHPYMGVTLRDGNVSQSGAQRAAAIVNQVSSGTPAAKAGLRQGDAIIAIDSDPVNGSLSLTAQVRARAVGDRVTLTVIRDGKQVKVAVTLAARPTG